PRLEQIDLTQKKMRQRKLGIKRNSFLRVLFSDWIKLLTKQHASGKEIRRCRFRRDVEHFGEGASRVRIVFSLDIAKPENVGGVHVRTRVPGLDFFEQRDSICRAAV